MWPVLHFYFFLLAINICFLITYLLVIKPAQTLLQKRIQVESLIKNSLGGIQVTMSVTHLEKQALR
jgi:uncharacterized membrane-anchored protein YitT (DUF2179 family)